MTNPVVFGFLFALAVSTASAQSIPAKADAAMRRAFGQCELFETKTIIVDSTITNRVYATTGQVFRGKLSVREALDTKKHPIGFGIVDDVRGKAQPITYITLIKSDGSIADVEVLAYREPYGGEIQYESFRKQFRGKDAKSQLRVGRDVQNIAGATISSKAITAGAKKIVVLFDELRKAGKL